MKGWALLLLALAAPLPAQTAETLLAGHDRLTRSPACRQGWVGEIVVCARPNDDRFRLPDYDAAAAAHSLAPSVESHMALAAATPGSRDECGIFANQRRCSKADMVASGWGGGRDPITALGRMVGVTEAPPPPLPPGASGAR